MVFRLTGLAQLSANHRFFFRSVLLVMFLGIFVERVYELKMVSLIFFIVSGILYSMVRANIDGVSEQNGR